MNDVLWVLLAPSSLLLFVAVYVWTALALSAIFGKMGEESWRAWVPVLNIIVVLRRGGFSPWLVILAFIPGVNIVFLVIAIIACHRVGRGFGAGAGMTVLAALLFPAWATVLGWGSARWLGPEDAPETGPLRRSPPPLEDRLAPGPGDGPSIFGSYGVAGGADIPPRPPAPRGFPSVMPDLPPDTPHPRPEPARASGIAPPPPPAPSAEVRDDSAVPALRRSSTPEAEPSDPAAEADAADDFLGRVPFTQTTPAVTAAPPPVPHSAPISAVPRATDVAPDDWTPPPVPSSRASTRLPLPPEAEPHYETSAEVSAVQGAPTLGAPMAARTSVSARHTEPEIPDDALFDQTVAVPKRRTRWSLVPPLGVPVALTATTVILGRRPAHDPDFPGAQLVPVADETRTMSKTHARIELRDDEWVIIDLDSTNGIILITPDGDEVDAVPGAPVTLTDRFLLGDAEMRLRRDGA